MSRAIETEHLSKYFGEIGAVSDVSMTVEEGEVFGLLGLNGAGKTTLIRVLTTLLIPTSGTARIAGCDLLSEASGIRQAIGVVPQANTTDLDLTGWENLDIYGQFYAIPHRERRRRSDSLLEIVGLRERRNDLVATYSGGMRRRLEIARGLVHRPRILFLDEPTIGLDPQTRRVIWDLIRSLREEGDLTIFLTTHYMEEAEAICDRVAIIDSGRIVASGSPEELKRQIPGYEIVEVTLTDRLSDRTDLIALLSEIGQVEEEDGLLRISVEHASLMLPRIIDMIRSHGGEIGSLSLRDKSLEDVFIHFTGRSIRDEGGNKVSYFIGAGVPRRMY